MTGSRGLRVSRALLLVASSLLLIAALAVFIIARPHFGRPVTYAGTPITPPKAASDATLLDGKGQPAHVLAPGVPLTFLFFGYTHCPDECPLALASLAKAYRDLPPAQAARTRIVFVTVDPEHDSPAVVERYVTGFDPHFIGLTDSRAALEPLWKAYGVAVNPESHEISHGDAIYAIDATAHVVLIYPPSVPAADLASDAAKLTS